MAVSDNEKIREIKDNLTYAEDATSAEYEVMIEDLNFIEGKGHWPQDLEAERTADGRPCLRINKLPAFLDRITGEQRRNRAAIKVSPVDDDADVDTARIFGGLIRNIEQQSTAITAYSTAEDAMTACGLGAWRVVTEYADDNTFNQDIKIQRIKNQFSVFYDPDTQELDKSDAKWCVIPENLIRSEYKRRYPDADPCEFDANRDDYGGWVTKDRIRIAEYFEKVIERNKLYLIRYPDGETETTTELPADDLDAEPGERGYEIIKEREVETTRVEWRRVNGKETIEGPERWAGKYIPIVMVSGKELNIENRTVRRGFMRHSKDSTRLYNYARSASAEKISLVPKSPYIVTAKMLKGYTKQWDTSMKRNYPYLYVNADKDMQGSFPQRQMPQMVETGIQHEVMVADQELHDTTGMQLSSLGKKSNEKSGVAVRERAREADIGNITYTDNMGVSQLYTAKILVDLIPKILDTARVERIINEDDTQEQVKINQPFEKDGPAGRDGQKAKIAKIYDLTVGKYDVAISIGPSYKTQRQESVDGMIQYLAADPEAAPLTRDLVVGNMDWPGADEMAERLRKTIPPELTQEADEDMPQGPPGPPSEEQAMAETMAEIEIETAEVKLAQEKADLKTKKAEAETAEIGIQLAQKELASTEIE